MARKLTEKSFEEKIARLEEIVALLEKGDAPLTDTLRLYEEGTGLISQCSAQLEQAEQLVVSLRAGTDGKPEEILFQADEAEQ